ncbi:leucine-rich repeat-containing protein 43 isoform X2 [Hippocampus comes]|uniref:leucine-rich repeat-containing protein 43 isoform X2 n=1 Tax=Hippocampus comes TaxID=109280 RepID=UPI00094E5B70|nr:PREDICTED: leucine-rich repeat-containing protein 43 isoform X2 [Hippocampus comes]
MSSVALSAVLDKHIRRLCLDQFPCGKGSWRKDGGGGGSEAEAVTEDTDTLLDLLSCPHSPWHHDEPWSPQAAALQRVAVVQPERLDADFVCSYFRKLRIVDKDLPAEVLQPAGTCAQRQSHLRDLSREPPQDAKGFGAACQPAARPGPAGHLSAPSPAVSRAGCQPSGIPSRRHPAHRKPELVCLDLSECDFREQRPLLKALGTLPCLRTLVLEGNPFTLAPSYPGFAVDALPRLSYLDAAWIAPEERHRYRGMANMSHLLVDWASATVCVGVMQGVPDPQLDADPDAPEFPVVSYSYVISYMFFSHQSTAYREVVIGAAAKRQSQGQGQDQGQDQGAEPIQTPNKRTVKETVVVQAAAGSQEQAAFSYESRYSTSSQPWADSVDFGDTVTFVVRDLSGFQKFLHQGFSIFIEQEKILSWPTEASDDAPGQGVADNKGKKAKTKDKRKKTVVELVADPPVTTVVASSHVPLHGLLSGYPKVDVLCDFGPLHKDPPPEDAAAATDEVAGMDNKAKDDSKKKGGRAGNKKTATAKGTRRGEDGDADTPTRAETATLELSVELKKWRHASEVAPLGRATAS